MPLQQEISKENYIKVHKVYVSSADRTASSQSRYDYFIRLPTQIQYVVGLEITGYNLPSDLAPTFITSGAGGSVLGTDKVDFELTNGVTTTVFTATWPQKQYDYQNVTVPYLSYVDILQQIMQDAVDGDAVFGIGGPNQATFVSDAVPEEQTQITVSGTGITGFRMLFASGPNAINSSYLAMGWNQVDTASSLVQLSPSRAVMKPYRYVDFYLDCAPEFRPLKRIYMTDNVYYGTVRNDPNLTRTRLLSSQPIRLLEKFRVQLFLEGNVVPPVTSNSLDHEFTLTVFSLANEVNVPTWMNQVFVL